MSELEVALAAPEHFRLVVIVAGAVDLVGHGTVFGRDVAAQKAGHVG